MVEVPPPAGDDASMPPSEAMAAMAETTRITGSLRVRLEGMTLVIWGICMAASYLTIAVPIIGGRPERGFGQRPPFNESFNASFNGTLAGHGPPPTAFFFSAFAPLVWFLIAAIVTIVLWRSMSVSFQPTVSTPRIAAVLVGWLLLFVVAAVLLTFVAGGNPRAWHLLAWSFVLALLAGFNPLRFARRTQWAVGVVAILVAISSLYALVSSLEPRDTSFLSGLVLGLSLLIAGLYVMMTG